MYFKQIEMAGFKSFADRIEVRFDSGVTAIVGPNGCGKSNVADAIRWVLGEQSSKLLRGSSMQDVIFNGTEKRKSLSYSEVTLVFNNQDRFFRFDYDELAITRKLYRSGESEYLINRVPCRLRDIIDLLHDSGIGRDGYSIIGQGKVEEIISSKPENRRAIFEEAAGIAKFKAKKVESERKLERVRDNLTRLNDIIIEIEKQVEPLRKQSETAKKYLELKDILKDLETNIYLYQFDNASEAKEKIQIKLNALLEELKNKNDTLEQSNNEYNKSMNDVGNIDTLIESLHNEVLDLTVQIEKQAGEVNVIRERIKILNEQKDKINLDILNSQNASEKLTLENEFKAKKLEEETKRINETKQKISELTNRYLLLIDELALSEGETETKQKEMMNALDKIADIKSNFSRLTAEMKALEENIAQSKEKQENLQRKFNEQKAIQESALTSVNASKQQKVEYDELCASLETEISVCENRIRDAISEKNSYFAKIQVYENKRRLLLDMQAEYEGFAGAVRRILKESERNANIKNKMVGVLASLIKVPEKYETAVEMALGNAVQNIVTKNENDAKELIAFLKDNQAGRATFMPINTMRPRSVSPEERRQLKMQGVFGIADELISFPKEISPAISNLLGATVIVDNLDTAVIVAKATGFTLKIVTLEGDIVNPQGSLTGGSKKSDSANLISREREIESLAKDAEKFKTNIAELTKTIQSLEDKKKNLLNDLASKNRLRSDTDIAFAKDTEKLDNIEFVMFSINEDIEKEKMFISQAETKIAFIQEELGSIKQLEDSEKSNRQMVNETIENRQQKFGELRTERDEIASQITSLKVVLATSEGTIDALNNDIERIRFEIEDQVLLKQDLEKELARNEQTIFGAESIINAQIETKTSSEVREKLKAVKDKQANLDQIKQDLQTRIKELDTKRGEIQTEISRLSERKFHEEMNLSKVDTDIEAMQERIFEEYNLTYQTCLPFRRADFDLKNGLIESNKIKKDIARLGYINVNAIEDFKVLNERYTELKTQSDDLEKSQNDLTKIIKELSTEMVTKFDTEFRKINENFKQTFKELFGGGNARLELLDAENLLDSGIEIVAEPPGKKLQSITLLSGGEKALTAIAILFAILKLRPMPFCLLDEIEAALDDANVDRFAQYLRRFSKETQFIVITHRKPTMELADSLYGVTMEEKGVSKIVSVKLSEAVKNIKAG